jgi:hypothetical protein
MIRLWVVLSALWCAVVIGWAYSLAVDRSRSAYNLAWETAKTDCSNETGDKNAQCVAGRVAELASKYEASVDAYFRRIVGGANLPFTIAVMIVPPLLVLGGGAIVAWVLGGFRARP